MSSELPFPGFNNLVEQPLSNSDQRSLSVIKRIILEERLDSARPFTILLRRLSGKTLPNSEAATCWQQIIKHKTLLQRQLGRTVGIQTAAIDYFEYQSPTEILLHLPFQKMQSPPPVTSKPSDSLYTQNYHLEKLKEEILRTKRYKHALSVILLEIDNFTAIKEALSDNNEDKILTTIVGIIKSTTRTVDILNRLSGDRFFLILPNTNGREAKELADRIRCRIQERTARLPYLSQGVTATLALGQCSSDTASMEFIKRLEMVLTEGTRQGGNAVFSIF
jgi:diguanylate cyclase (GGDEF)-like protein